MRGELPRRRGRRAHACTCGSGSPALAGVDGSLAHTLDVVGKGRIALVERVARVPELEDAQVREELAGVVLLALRVLDVEAAVRVELDMHAVVDCLEPRQQILGRRLVAHLPYLGAVGAEARD